MDEPESPHQPDPKKLKMSTTALDDETTLSNPNKTPKYKRRKIAIFFAYCGVGYQGMQRNPGAKTIEADLEEALFLAGAVPEADRGCPKRFDWARSARTDKGVSAVGQVVSGRFYIDPPGLVDRLNSILPDQIRIFGFKRATPSFNAKKFCDRRRYVYLIPVFALDPSSHPDRESVLASLGSGNELVKCLDCSERGRKVEGAIGKHPFKLKDIEIEETAGSGISSNRESAMLETEIGEENGVIIINGDANSDHHKDEADLMDSDIPEIEITQTGISSSSGATMLETKIVEESGHVDNKNVNSDKNKDNISENVGLGIETQTEVSLESDIQNDNAAYNTVKDDGMDTNIHENVCLAENGEINGVFSKGNDDGDLNTGLKNVNDVVANGEEKETVKKSGFRYGEEERKRFNRILKSYVGTHNFHNFTTRIKAEDPSATRYIISFNANTVVNVDGIDFVKCEVVGQSFMLHQIRKMVGVAVAIMRNCADESLIETAFQKELRITVPTAPEVGLYLDECFFSFYNQKWKDTHEEVSMTAYAKEAEEFKMKYIYSHIASMEQKEGSVALWLHSLNHRNYPDLRIGGTAKSLEGNGDEPK